MESVDLNIDNCSTLFNSIDESNKLQIYYLKKMMENTDYFMTDNLNNGNLVYKIGEHNIGKHLKSESIICMIGFLFPDIIQQYDTYIVKLDIQKWNRVETNWMVKNESGIFTYIKQYNHKLLEQNILTCLNNLL